MGTAGAVGKGVVTGEGLERHQLRYAGRDAGGDSQPVAVTIGMKPSALPIWAPPFVSSREYSGLEVYLVEGSFPAAIVG